MTRDDAPPTQNALPLVTEQPMARRRVVLITVGGFTLLVGLVVLAAYLGYSGANRIQDTAQQLVP